MHGADLLTWEGCMSRELVSGDHLLRYYRFGNFSVLDVLGNFS
jgi:hypothetical protein